MATQIVEVSGDERKLLQALDRMVAKELEAERALGAMGDAGAAAGTDIERALARVARANDKDMGKFIADLGRIGPEGKAAAEALKSSFRTDGKFGQQGVDSIIASIRKIDPEAADAAEKVVKEMEEADKDSEFRETLKSLEKLGDEGRQAAAIIEAELKDAEDQAAAGMDQILAKLQELKPEAGLSADAIEAKLKAAADASQKEFDDTVTKLREMGPAGAQIADRLAAEMKAAADKSENSIDGMIAKLGELNPEAAKAANSIYREINASTNKAKGSFKDLATTAGADLKSIVASYIGIQEAISLVIDLNRKVAETNREAFGNLKKTESGDARLLQVSSSTEEFNQLRGNADELAGNFGIDREQARQLVFQGKSENFSDTLDFIGQNSQVIDVQAQAQVAGQIPGLFAASGEKLTGAEAINQTLAGAAESRLSFEEIARALPSAAEGGSLAGASSDETIATLSVLAGRFKSADTAADRIKALATKIGLDKGTDDRASLAGSGLLDAVDKIAALPEDQRTAFLGASQEVNAAYEFIQQENAKIRSRQEVIKKARQDTGTAASPTAIRREAAQNDPRLAVQLEARKAAIQKEIEQEERRAVTEGQRQKKRDLALRDAEKQGVSKTAIAAAESVAGSLELAGFEDDGSLVRAASETPLENLFRDVSFASRKGDERSTAASLAVSKLRNLRREDPNAILGQDATAEFIRGTTGDFVSPVDVTDEQRQALTQSILAEAKEARGLERSASLGVVGFVDSITGGNAGSVPFVGPASQQIAGEGRQAAADIQSRFLQSMKETLERNNQLMEQQIEAANRSAAASEATAAASATTAANTTQSEPEPINYGNIQRGRAG